MAVDAGKILATLELDTSAFAGGLNTAKSLMAAWSSEASTGRDRLEALGKAATSLGSSLTKSVTLPLVAMGTAATTVFTNFDDAMRQVRATMGLYDESNAETAAQIEALTDAAKEMGATTRYSASEAASALNYLALAGYDADKAISTLPTVLRLAQAGGMELGGATELLTQSMNALGLSADETVRFVDEMAVTSQKSGTNISQLGNAITTVGATAANLKGGTAELNAELGILADAGYQGAEGGTALRNVMLALMQPTSDGAKALEKYTKGVYDAEGNMRSLDDVLGELKASLAGMNDAARMDVIGAIFNKRDMAAAQALIAGSGERFKELTGYINDCEGAAESMADVMEGGIGGAFRNLTSATEGLMIAIGDELAPKIKSVAEFVTGLARGFTELDEGTRKTIVTIGTIAATVGPALLIIGKLTTAIAAINPVVLGVTAAVAGLIALIAKLNQQSKFDSSLSGRLKLTMDESELEEYKVPTEITPEDNEVVANIQLRIHNNAESAYDQIVKIMNDGVAESADDYLTMANAVNTIIDEVHRNITSYWNIKKADLQALFDNGLISQEEYDTKMAEYNAKQTEMEGALETQATAVTDYIQTLIAANRPMTEAEIAYLQELINKLVDVAEQAAASEEAVIGAYANAYKRVQMGVPLEGDTEAAATYIEMRTSSRRDEAREAAQRNIDEMTATADAATAALTQYAEGSAPYLEALAEIERMQQGILERQGELDQQLAGIEEDRQELYADLAEGVTDEETEQGFINALNAYIQAQDELDRLQSEQNLWGGLGGLFGWSDSQKAIDAQREAVTQLGEELLKYDDQMQQYRELLGYEQANNPDARWNLNSYPWIMQTLGGWLDVEPEMDQGATAEQTENANDLVNELVKQVWDETERRLRDEFEYAHPGLPDIDYEYSSDWAGQDNEKALERAREAEEAAQAAQESTEGAAEAVKNEAGEVLDAVALLTSGWLQENQTEMDELAKYAEETGLTVSRNINGVIVTILDPEAYAATGRANGAAYVAAWNAELTGLQTPGGGSYVVTDDGSGGSGGSGGSSGGGGSGGTTVVNNNYSQTINASSAGAAGTARQFNRYATSRLTGKGTK